MRRGVFHGESVGEKLGPQVADVLLVLHAEQLAFLRLQNLDRLPRSRQNGRRQGCRKDKTSSVTSYHVDEVRGTRDVAADVAECLACPNY